ncbi:MAG: hypothetical protein P9F75_17715 [Candidatus Contendobacter sp.]|nr:hypothetical protein [Candidatus Contendobacter sp.]
MAPIPEERQAHSAAETRRLIDEMPLQALRWALELTPQQVARARNRSERRPLRASGLVLGLECP